MRLCFWLALLCATAAGQASPPVLKLPPPAIPAPPPPRTTYTPPPPSKWDAPLLYSQLTLAGAGTGATTAAQIRRYQDESKVPAFTSVGVVGLAILLERAYGPAMSPRAKKWVSIGNFAASGVLAGFATRDIGQTRSTLNKATGGK